LYRKISILFESTEPPPALKNAWAIRYNTDYFRITQNNLPEEEIKQRKNWSAKLANLPKNCKGTDLKGILSISPIKTLFIPRVSINGTYGRARYAYITFSSKEDYEKEMNRIFLYKGKAVQIVQEKTPTCHQCGSVKHRIRNCKEAQVMQRKVNRNIRLQPVYDRLNITPAYPKGFKPTLPEIPNFNPRVHHNELAYEAVYGVKATHPD
jgi:hypothetical protein